MTLAGLPLYVDLAAVAGAGTAVDALAACERAEIGLVRWAAPLPAGERIGAELAHWQERLLLHHDCLDAAGGPRWNLAAGDDELRKRAVAGAAEAMRRSADLGAPFYSLEAGFALKFSYDATGQPVGPTIPVGRARDQLCRSLDRLAGVADDMGLRLLIENAPERPRQPVVFGDPEVMLALLERLAAPPLAIQLDLVALLVTARTRADEPESLIEALRPATAALVLYRGDRQPLRENDLEIALARHAEGLARPIVLAPRALAPALLREQVSHVCELLPPAMPTGGKSEG